MLRTAVRRGGVGGAAPFSSKATAGAARAGDYLGSQYANDSAFTRRRPVAAPPVPEGDPDRLGPFLRPETQPEQPRYVPRSRSQRFVAWLREGWAAGTFNGQLAPILLLCSILCAGYGINSLLGPMAPARTDYFDQLDQAREERARRVAANMQSIRDGRDGARAE